MEITKEKGVQPVIHKIKQEDKYMGIEKIYEILIRLLAQQEEVDIEYHLEDVQKDKTA